MITLIISGETALGPLEEKEATIGATTSLGVSPTKIVATGFLQLNTYISTKIAPCD